MADKEKLDGRFIPPTGNEPADGPPDQYEYKILRCRSQRCGHHYLGKLRNDRRPDEPEKIELELLCPICKTVNSFIFVVSVEK